MSVDTDPGTGTDPVAVDCSLCDHPTSGSDGVAVQCYPAADGDDPGVAAADGFVGVCGDCRAEVDDLFEAWTSHEAPPVGADHSIRAGYRRVVDDCSFCDRGLDGVALGVECYGLDAAGSAEATPDEASTDGADNYALCDGCAPVFDRFLEQVRAHATG